MKKIFLILFVAIAGWSYDLDWIIYKQETFNELPKIPGFCSKEKAQILMDLIYEIKPQLIVEIGPLCGSTTYPMARTLSFIKQGLMYSIDAWDNDAALENLDADDPKMARYWRSLNANMDWAFANFVSMLSAANLNTYCKFIKTRSENAIVTFNDQTIDLLFIDGNSSVSGSLRDAMLYLPKVKSGGYIFLNLAHLLAKSETIFYLLKHCTILKDKSLGIECIAFKKK